MSIKSISDLNNRFGIEGQLTFTQGPGEFAIAVLNIADSTAQVCLYGGQVLSYQQTNQPPILWLSKTSQFKAGKAIRGGIPICWPWFGPHPHDPTKPAHGIARTAEWQVDSSELITENENGKSVKLVLNLPDSNLTKTGLTDEIQLQLEVTLSTQLQVKLITSNLSTTSLNLSMALHSYFNISQIDDILVHGLENISYIDKLENNTHKQSTAPININREVDRVYIHTEHQCIIEDPHYVRDIIIKKSGSLSTVVWNPWMEKSKNMTDMENQGYQNMICVETANTANNSIKLPPGEKHTMSQSISVKSK